MEGVFTVSEINNNISRLLEGNFYDIGIEGEISDYKVQSQGWTFFSLKDSKSIISCVNFDKKLLKYKDIIKDGVKVIGFGYLTIYEKTGKYQFYVKDLKVIGSGDIYAQIEITKQKLKEEGLFSAENKKNISSFPLNIGVITSLEKSSMAYKDFCKTMESRFPIANIYLYDANVQGKEAEKEIIQGLEYFKLQENIDVIVLTRGGGSIEDLMPFNSESVARSIFNSTKITVSAIGHEGDVTISDLVADIRASTPTQAAILISPDKKELIDKLNKGILRAQRGVQDMIEIKQTTVAHNYEKIKGILDKFYNKKQQTLSEGVYILQSKSNEVINRGERILKELRNKISKFSYEIEYKSKSIKEKFKMFELFSPEYILKKGYSITYKDGKLISSVNDVNMGDMLQLRLKDGNIKSEVIEK